MTLNDFRPWLAGRFPILAMAGLTVGVASFSVPAAADSLRPPAVPLVTHDPYFSIWSQGDKLTDVETTHWTGKPHRLTSLAIVDGKPYRLMGAEPASVPPLPQTGLQLLPTRTIYSFEGAGVGLTLTFMTPALPGDLDLLARPVTYVTYECWSIDGGKHSVGLHLSASGELAVDRPADQVVARMQQWNDLMVMQAGSLDQRVLARRGDDLRIDWGWFYLAAGNGARIAWQVLPNGRAIPLLSGQKEGMDLPAPVAGGDLQLAVALDPFTATEKPVSRWLMLAYDDLHSIQYLKQNLRPYWRRNGWEARDLLKAAAADYESLRRRCESFDAELIADLRQAGGDHYAEIATLAYRQCFAASKFVADANGQPLSFSKENHSNGCIGTSDVFYPMAPQFLLFGPSVAKSFLVPFMNYAASDRWKFPFAPHDLGTYPQANGQRYGGGERSEENQMPVEESGNLLILMAAVAEMEGHADFAGLYWPQLTQWAEYLKAKGFDPENQLCTDDFAGHLAHNVNLSAKAICGIACYAKLCEMRGDRDTAREYAALAKAFVGRWLKEADDGDHYRLAFDKAGTWSQKYNIVWDRILDLDLWPREALRREMDHYRRVQNTYGLPLDNRSQYTKLDWVLWTATLTQDREDFDALVDPVWKFLNETPDRSPMTDWYWTHDAKKRGFTARPVVGGVFLQMLYNQAVWQKYAGRDVTQAAGYAPAPKPPRIVVLVPAADEAPAMWRYTTRPPGDGWNVASFDDSGWPEGCSGFGTRNTPGAVVNTVWDTSDIWLRREIEVPDGDPVAPALWIHHDEDAEIFVDGIRVRRLRGFTTGYETEMLSAEARRLLTPGRHLLAIHCRQTSGGQYIDLGLVDVRPAE